METATEAGSSHRFFLHHRSKPMQIHMTVWTVKIAHREALKIFFMQFFCELSPRFEHGLSYRVIY
jgi:hypothetical protein